MSTATAIITIAESPAVAHVFLVDSAGVQIDDRPVFAPLGSEVVNDSDIAAAINDMVSVAIFRGFRSIVIRYADAAQVVN